MVFYVVPSQNFTTDLQVFLDLPEKDMKQINTLFREVIQLTGGWSLTCACSINSIEYLGVGGTVSIQKWKGKEKKI